MNIKQIAQKYNLNKEDFWELKRGTKSMWIITHDACEKIAAKKIYSLEHLQYSEMITKI